MEMNLSRRGFLTGMVAVASATALPSLPFAEEIPTLWGDMIHDDTAALQALLDAKPIIRDGQLLRPAAGARILLRGGSYLVSDTLRLRHYGTRIEDVHMKFVGHVDVAIDLSEAGSLYRCSIDGSAPQEMIDPM